MYQKTLTVYDDEGGVRNFTAADVAELQQERNDLRAELTEARLVIAGFQSGVTPCDCQPGEFCKPSAPVPQPAVKVGDSFFESWYSLYNPEGKSTKQTMREAYAAGLVDREGRTDWQPAVPEAVAKDAAVGAAIERAARDLPQWCAIEVRVERGSATVYAYDGDCEEVPIESIGEGTLAEEIDAAVAAILSATDSEGRKDG